MPTTEQTERPRTEFTRESIIEDYRTAFRSRQASLIGRREVLTGKAKFGIFGDGKEVAQLAMARAFRKGDWRSGYYRDQTFMLAVGAATLEQFFAQLYAHADVEHDPWSGGRSMNAHFASRLLDASGNWIPQIESYNISADASPTGSQMPRLVGLAWASRLYREVEALKEMTSFSRNGDEIAWGTIGNASCAEGMFWESLNAGGVLQVPMIVSIWDDGYGISVPNAFQITKDLSELLEGFRRQQGSRHGYDLYRVKAWDYAALTETYLNAATIVRSEHVPAIIHVVEVTQPQGHSTSGSHERYKSKERLEWEIEFDAVRKMREWMIAQNFVTSEAVDALDEEDRTIVRDAQRRAWEAYRAPLDADVARAVALLGQLAGTSAKKAEIEKLRDDLQRQRAPFRRDAVRALTSAIVIARDEAIPQELIDWRSDVIAEGDRTYAAHLYSDSQSAALRAEEVKPDYPADAPFINGFEIINRCFDAALGRDPRLLIFGEDVGELGDVNQGCVGLQDKYGLLRVSDTGIRECTILGQAIGAALRGLRPVAEIQYLDYLLYALQIMADDLSTTRWRSAGGQKCPVIVRTRGHRLEGIWHSGSPMAGIINLVRGMYVCVPRNMTQAAGFYNTLLGADDPAIVVEVLNGYRTKERLPANLSDFKLPLGVPEIMRVGSDVTLVSYGATLRIVQEAADLLATVGIDAEVIDVQTLLPFDVRGIVAGSVRKTSRVAFIDEDVPGGGTAYMLQQVVDRDRAYEWLDSEPRTISAKEHRPAYGSDGDYWSKPNRESIFESIYALMHEANPRKYPKFV